MVQSHGNSITSYVWQTGKLMPTLYTARLNTPLGQMTTVADDHAIYMLTFTDSLDLAKNLQKLSVKTNTQILEGRSKPIELLEEELKQYFNGTLSQFSTPINLFGTPFQQRVWHTLKNIPTGQTHSYAKVAKTIGKPTAFRAVALANSKNPLAILVPCHRVINKNGKLGGYSCGIERKRWLLDHEKKKASYSLEEHREDMILSHMAKSRETEDTELINHKDAWK